VTKLDAPEFPRLEDAKLPFAIPGTTTPLEQEIEHLFRENYAALSVRVRTSPV
jgi:hypothetical protein